MSTNSNPLANGKPYIKNVWGNNEEFVLASKIVSVQSFKQLTSQQTEITVRYVTLENGARVCINTLTSGRVSSLAIFPTTRGYLYVKARKAPISGKYEVIEDAPIQYHTTSEFERIYRKVGTAYVQPKTERAFSRLAMI